MPANDGLKRYMEAALALTQITRARAEEVVRDLIRTGEVESNRAQDWVEDLVRTSRQRSEAFVSTIRSEVNQQLGDLGMTSIDEIARRVAEILEHAGTAARRATGGRGPRRAGGAKKRAAAKKAPAKTAAKRAPAKKATAKKSTAKKSAAAKKTAAKKTAAKRAPAKKTAAKKSAASRG
jgi:polyhydroxyalkanoate synthesis regulator phasin